MISCTPLNYMTRNGKTDWKLVREILDSAITACESVENLGISEEDRSATTTVNDNPVSVYEFLQSAWVYPENLRYSVIRARNKLGEDQPYTPETARIITQAAALCAELIGMESIRESTSGIGHHSPNEEQTVEELARNLIKWYREHMIPGLETAVGRVPGSKENK